MPDSILNKTAKCGVMGFTLYPILLFVCLTQLGKPSKETCQRVPSSGRINELSHNSEGENLKSRKVERRNDFYNNSSSFENGGILNRGLGPYNHMGDAVTKYLVIPDLMQWGNKQPYVSVSDCRKTKRRGRRCGFKLSPTSLKTWRNACKCDACFVRLHRFISLSFLSVLRFIWISSFFFLSFHFLLFCSLFISVSFVLSSASSRFLSFLLSLSLPSFFYSCEVNKGVFWTKENQTRNTTDLTPITISISKNVINCHPSISQANPGDSIRDHCRIILLFIFLLEMVPSDIQGHRCLCATQHLLSKISRHGSTLRR